MANEQLHRAKTAKNDEFYTRYEDIEAEMNAYIEYDKDVFRDKVILCPCDDPEWSNFTKYFSNRFEVLGLKKLICTSYAKSAGNKIISDYERHSPQFDEEKHFNCGKLFVLEKDTNDSGRIDKDDIEWQYLKGDGDFRSEEVTRLRDEADFIITNPMFSLWREFLAWIMKGEKKFIIIGSMNAITYKEVFPLIKDNKIWLGTTHPKNFIQPDKTLKKFGNILWYTNEEHGMRHEPMQLMSMEDNLKYNKKLRNKLKKDYGKLEYPQYHNYKALEIPIVEAIPSDYNDIMGVSISFLDHYCPSQFDIVGMSNYSDTPCRIEKNYAKEGYNFFKSDGLTKSNSGALKDKMSPKVYGKGRNDYSVSPEGTYLHAIYQRIFIRRKQDV